MKTPSKRPESKINKYAKHSSPGGEGYYREKYRKIESPRSISRENSTFPLAGRLRNMKLKTGAFPQCEKPDCRRARKIRSDAPNLWAIEPFLSERFEFYYYCSENRSGKCAFDSLFGLYRFFLN